MAICPVCGDIYPNRPNWAYRIKKENISVKCCSYGCMRWWEKNKK